MIRSWKTRARLDILKLQKRKCNLSNLGVTCLAIVAKKAVAYNRPPLFFRMKTKRRRAYIAARVLLTGHAHEVWKTWGIQ